MHIVRAYISLIMFTFLFQRPKYCITSRSRWQLTCGKIPKIRRVSLPFIIFLCKTARAWDLCSLDGSVFGGSRSLGVTTYVLLTGFSPFGGETDQETFQNISLGEVDFPEELFEDISAQAKDFVAKLLVLDPR